MANLSEWLCINMKEEGGGGWRFEGKDGKDGKDRIGIGIGRQKKAERVADYASLIYYVL